MASSRRGTRENMFSAAQKTAVVVPAEKSEAVSQKEEKATENLASEETDASTQAEANEPKIKDTEVNDSSVVSVSAENSLEKDQDAADVSSEQESNSTTNHESDQSLAEKVPISNELVMQMIQQVQKAVQENMQSQPQPIIKNQKDSEIIISDDQNEQSQERVVEKSEGKWAKGFSDFKESAKRKKAGSTRSIYFDVDILNYLEENTESGTSLSKLVNYLLRKAIEAVENGQ